MKFEAPAKINLTLEVLDRRADGYHGVRSVMVPLELHDDIEIEPAQRFAFHCEPTALENADNLVVRAVRACGSDAPVAVTLRKHIPTQAGLGGGSSDAAAIFLAAMDGVLGHRREIDWVAAARTLGSDVPFFLVQSGALVEATGERVTAVGALPLWHVLIVKPPASVSTTAAYAELDRVSRPTRPRSSSVSLMMLDALQRRSFHEVQSLLCNDFHETIAKSTPEVARALAALQDAGAVRPVLCGSGSAVFALAETAADIATIDTQLALPSDYMRFRTAFRHSGVWRG